MPKLAEFTIPEDSSYYITDDPFWVRDERRPFHVFMGGCGIGDATTVAKATELIAQRSRAELEHRQRNLMLQLAATAAMLKQTEKPGWVQQYKVVAKKKAS